MTEESTKKLMEAIRAGDKAALDGLLTQHPALKAFRAPNGSSLLLLTAYMRHPELAEVCHNHGMQADIFEACALGDLNTVKKAVSENPAQVNASAPDGFYPLSLAAYFGHRRIVEFLLASGADVHAAARNPQKVTALHAAASRGDVEIVRLLVEKGADVNAKQEGGFVPLHSAAANGNAPLVDLLLKHGAKADARNDKGKTPADVAEEAKHPELAARLKAPAA